MNLFIQNKMGLLVKIFKMPSRVVLFRAYQMARLWIIGKFNLWERFRQSSQIFDKILCGSEDIGKVLETSVLASIKAEKQIRDSLNKGEFETVVRGAAENILIGKYELLGSPMPKPDKIDWHTDWRFNYYWAPKYFKSYSFYGVREKPYDVKYPWELSRLQFVIPLLENAFLYPHEEKWLEKSIEIIVDWREKNPLARTVVWYPMEASMRLTCLVQLLDMSLLLKRQNNRTIELTIMLCKMIAEHGHFVWETREYTAQCGNHYAANLSGLCMAGLALRDIYSPARKWLKFSFKQIQKEILTQFYEDGVNFEKSTGYHRLVTELFLISLIGLEKAGFSIKDRVKHRIYHACAFARDMIRPDGMAVNFGDNDNAMVFNFSGLNPRYYNDFLNIAAAYFDDVSLLPDKMISNLVPKWFDFGLNNSLSDSMKNVSPSISYYKAGGYVAVRDGDNHLVIDVGEVGQYGLGGHGHNDLFSFELCFSGHAVIIDPGCPVYTGDQIKRNKYRSSFSHNICTVDQREIANMPGFWRIENTAMPKDITVQENGGEIHVTGRHTGYENLADPVTCYRDFVISLNEGIISCIDRFTARSLHTICRRFTLSPDVQIEHFAADNLLIKTPVGQAKMTWGENTRAKLKNVMISNGFGSEQVSQTLVLSDEISGDNQLEFMIEDMRGVI